MHNPLLRVLLIVPLALALLSSWFALRWYVGGFVAEFAPRMEEGQLDAATAAMDLAPDDPWTHWTVAGLKKRTFSPNDLTDAVRQYEEAVRLSPNDYRFWLDLGRAREAAGDAAGGEKALRRAVELAPAYAYPRWYLGNLLLRAGRGEEAFAELRRAADANAEMRPQLFNVAWALYGPDIGAVRKVIGDTPATRAELATYLLGRQRLDDAVNLWSSLSPGDKRAQGEVGAAIMTSLLGQLHYRAALDVLREMNPNAAPNSAQFINGGFEDDIDAQGGNPFSWQVKNDPQAQVAIDGSNRHNGARSLRVFFRAPETLSFSNVSQLIVVEPSTQYRLEFYVRAENLKSGSTPSVVVVSAGSGSTGLASSPPAPPGTYDWQPVTINFKTPPKIEAVVVRIERAPCDAVCPIFGMVWYDDFNLQSVGGAAKPRDIHK